MLLKYGAYSHENGEVELTISRDAIQDGAGRHYADHHRWLIRGRLVASSQSALTTAINSLQRAYEKNYQTVGLYLSDGSTLSSHILYGTNALGGVRVVRGPSFPEGKGAEYATYRTYEIELESEVPLATASSSLVIEWTELVSMTGGGPRFVYLQPLNGLPQRQKVADSTPFRVTQRGRAKGLGQYPLPAPPLWPAAEHIDQRQIDRDHPRRVGNRYVEYPVSWSYVFESATPLVGTPTLWRG